MIEIGTKVVCVDDRFDLKSVEIIPNLPKKDLVYTVIEIREYPKIGAIGILLEEIINPKLKHKSGYLFKPTFSINRFVPLDWTEGVLEETEVYETTGVL